MTPSEYPASLQTRLITSDFIASFEVTSEIIRNRLRDSRRAEIAEHARTARKQFDAGKLPVESVEEMVADFLQDDA